MHEQLWRVDKNAWGILSRDFMILLIDLSIFKAWTLDLIKNKVLTLTRLFIHKRRYEIM